MDYQNITLSIPKSVLIKVKHMAVEKQTSVSHLLVESMEEMAARDDLYQEAMKRNIKELDQNSLKTNGDLNINRDGLHE